jgi:hypothetical protein
MALHDIRYYEDKSFGFIITVQNTVERVYDSISESK